MCHSFERLRVIREYRSPRTIRSFTKVFIFIMPIVLSPYYVHMGYRSQNTWSPYFIAVLSTFIFGTLQGVQDVLDDPFDGISEDDINLGQVTGFPSHSRFCLLLPSYPMSFFFFLLGMVFEVEDITWRARRYEISVRVLKYCIFHSTRFYYINTNEIPSHFI